MGDILEVYEKKYILENLYELYYHGRIVFPVTGFAPNNKRKKELNDIMEALNIGIPIPPVYVLELQNGNYLLLETTGRLRGLLEFLAGRQKADIYYKGRMTYDLYYDEMLHFLPVLCDRIMNAKITFYIVDYNSPLYMQMQAAKITGELSPSREQEIREILYGDFKIRYLKAMTNTIENGSYNRRRRSGGYRNSYTSRYRCLYMCMLWLVYKGMLRMEGVMLEQHMLDETLYQIHGDNPEIREFESFATARYGNMWDWMDERRDVPEVAECRRLQKLYGYLICAMHIGWKRGILDYEVLDIVLESGFIKELIRQVNSVQMDIEKIEINIQRLNHIVR